MVDRIDLNNPSERSAVHNYNGIANNLSDLGDGEKFDTFKAIDGDLKNKNYVHNGTEWVENASGGGGGGGGTTDYNDLSNKPQINGIELVGNKTTEQLGLGKVKFKRLDVKTDTGTGTLGIYDGDTLLTMNDIKELYQNPDWYIYLEYLNTVMIPEARYLETSNAFEFGGQFQENRKCYLARVIINIDNVVQYNQIEIEKTENKVKSIDDYDDTNEEQYFNANAIKEYVDSKIAVQNYRNVDTVDLMRNKQTRVHSDGTSETTLRIFMDSDLPVASEINEYRIIIDGYDTLQIFVDTDYDLKYSSTFPTSFETGKIYDLCFVADTITHTVIGYSAGDGVSLN